MKTILPTALSVILFSLPIQAEVTANALFGDNAVLQQGMKVPVWGTASAGEKVTVSFGGQKVEAVTKDGKWMVWLDRMKADATPKTMTISGGTNTLTYTNLLVGEVWVCSGQSNMERQLGPRNGQKPLANYEAEAASANYPALRHFLVKQTASTNPMTSLTGSWLVCSPDTVMNFTAVGYYFGRDLNKSLGVPIGLIHSSWGGTRAEGWTRTETMTSNPILSTILTDYTNSIASYPQALAKFNADLPKLQADYTNACVAAKAAGKPAPRPPHSPGDPSKNPSSPARLYNGMIHPLIPYAMRGVIWYQGESNANDAKRYRELFPTMITDWRTQWGEGNFPFLYVQIAPNHGIPPEIREAQLLTLKRTSNTAMAVITDHGDANNIHPVEKEPVGQRLALAARALAYGEKIEYSGPLFSGSRIDGNKVVISFAHVGKGLVSKDGPLKGFVIAGADKKFVPAQAEITGETVTVSSPEVPAPVAARYGWANVPDVNLYNKEALPASPFRTDDWETATNSSSPSPTPLPTPKK